MKEKSDWKATFPGKPEDVISKDQFIRARLAQMHDDGVWKSFLNPLRTPL